MQPLPFSWRILAVLCRVNHPGVPESGSHARPYTSPAAPHPMPACHTGQLSGLGTYGNVTEICLDVKATVHGWTFVYSYH